MLHRTSKNSFISKFFHRDILSLQNAIFKNSFICCLSHIMVIKTLTVSIVSFSTQRYDNKRKNFHFYAEKNIYLPYKHKHHLAKKVQSNKSPFVPF